jgi:hypothetical protein
VEKESVEETTAVKCELPTARNEKTDIVPFIVELHGRLEKPVCPLMSSLHVHV